MANNGRFMSATTGFNPLMVGIAWYKPFRSDGSFEPVLWHRFVKLRTCYEAINSFTAGFEAARKNEK